MKRTLLVLIIAVAFIAANSGCARQNPLTELKPQIQKLKNTVYDGRNDKSRKGDVEKDINAEDIQEDINLTKQAVKNGSTESKNMVPQEMVDKNKSKIQTKGTLTFPSAAQAKVSGAAAPPGTCPVSASIIQAYSTTLPATIQKNLKYTNYPIAYDYLLVTGSNVNLRNAPGTGCATLRKTQLYEKFNLAQSVKGAPVSGYNSDVWYRTFWRSGNNIQYGFVFNSSSVPRNFQFSKMATAISNLKKELESNWTGFVSNYKNRNGTAPLHKGSTVDPYGNVQDQSAPGYLSPNSTSDFRYFPDGTLVTILGQSKYYYRVRTLGFAGEYWIPKQYVSLANPIKNLTKVIVVDRKNQNEAVFEYINGKWNLVSYTLATTGVKAQYKYETPLGYFMAIEKKDKFLYLDDVTNKVVGYAPYAIRFSGGGYVHGVPVAYKIVNGKQVDPGMQEYLYTIGTIPRSHKCVRNYTSHAKFLYNWAEIGKTAVIVLE